MCCPFKVVNLKSDFGTLSRTASRRLTCTCRRYDSILWLQWPRPTDAKRACSSVILIASAHPTLPFHLTRTLPCAHIISLLVPIITWSLLPAQLITFNPCLPNMPIKYEYGLCKDSFADSCRQMHFERLWAPGGKPSITSPFLLPPLSIHNPVLPDRYWLFPTKHFLHHHTKRSISGENGGKSVSERMLQLADPKPSV